MVFPIQLFASEGIFLNLSSARNLAGELNFYKTVKADDDLVITELEKENNQYLQLSKEYENKILFLDKDKDILRTRGDKFENEYMSCSKSLIECKSNVPSRFVWFSSGILASLILTTVIIYGTK